MTAYRARKRYSEDGIEAIHRRDPDPDYERKFDGEDEAHLIALACSDPPDGRRRWTLRLLADELVALEETDVESVSHETIRQTLKKAQLNPGKASGLVGRMTVCVYLQKIARQYGFHQ